MSLLARAFTFALLLAMSCGGHVDTEPTPVADAAASADAGGVCTFDGVASCSGGALCCGPIQAHAVDLARGCVSARETPQGCYAPRAKRSCSLQPGTGDPMCFAHLGPDGGIAGVFVTSGQEFNSVDGIVSCDATTRAAVPDLYARCP